MSVKFDGKVFLQNTSSNPGVYQMFGADDKLLYVGKASNLKKRLSSYFRSTGLSVKNKSLMSQVKDIRLIVTNSETEALILENNLIKENHPKYNILLRDDKTYPYIHLTDEKYPRLRMYRGSRNIKGKFFGPYPNVNAVKETLDIIQKTFLIRISNDAFYKNSSGMRFLYQIKRFVAPSLDLLDEKEYKLQVEKAVSFLEGRNNELIKKIEENMLTASKRQDFESAAFYRDKLQSLRRIVEKQYITNEKGNADVIAILREGSITIIQVFYYRNGQSLGSQSYFPKVRYENSISEILQSFIEQIYFDKSPPKEIITNESPQNSKVLVMFFQEKFNISVRFSNNPRSFRARWLKLAVNNANIGLYNKKTSITTLNKQFDSLSSELGIIKQSKLIACVDISHTQGESTVASYVVFDRNGPKKSDYRKYNINNIKNGDDYAAMENILKRRFFRFIKDSKNSDITEKMPDILFVDGGVGQFNVAKKVFLELCISNVFLVGVAKGADRKVGMERLIVGSSDNIVKLKSHSLAMHLIQQIRDESHRFAIMGHRKKRDKKRFDSILKEIEGIGDKRKQYLLKYFAGIKGLKNASVEELQKVNGISPKLAARIYEYFH